MDVDMLRPGTVPMSPDTILGFEFLLDQQLLKKHLQRPFPEPSATDLIAEFLSVDDNLSRKHLALKILALKIAATCKWNLNIFETKLTPVIQQQLVYALVYMATDGAFDIQPQDIPMTMRNRPEVQFALTLYHRWILRSPVKAALQAKSPKIPVVHLPGIPLENEYTHSSDFDKILRMNENSRLPSIKYLEEVVAIYGPSEFRCQMMKTPVMETFVNLTEDTDNMAHKWDTAYACICHHEFLVQIHFDLCCNYFFYGQHEKAKEHILGCCRNLKRLEFEIKKNGYGKYTELPWGDFNYASVSKEDLLGYIRALNLGRELLEEDRPLNQSLLESIANGYKKIMYVLQRDNSVRVIPMVHRQMVELDIHAALSSGADGVSEGLAKSVSAVNAIRYAQDGGLPSTHPDFKKKFKLGKVSDIWRYRANEALPSTDLASFFCFDDVKVFDSLLWALAPALRSNRLTKSDWNNIRIFILHLAISSKRNVDKIIDICLMKHVGEQACEFKAKLIDEKHLQTIVKDQMNNDDENLHIPRELLTDSWDTSHLEYESEPEIEYEVTPELEMGHLKKRLVEASTADDVRKSLVELAAMSPSAPLWKLSPYWKPIGNLGSTLLSLPRGFLQDFSVVVSSAARARAEAGNVRVALRLLLALRGEVRSQLTDGSDPVLRRLCRSLAWEVLLLQVNVMLTEWPDHRLDVALLAKRCKVAVAAANSDRGDCPRSQVTLGAWLCLLNLREWETEAVPAHGPDTSGAELAAALCAACAELQPGKSVRQLSRTLWDYVVSTFINSNTLKRSHNQDYHHSHPNHASHHGQLEHRSAYHAVIQALREPLAISVVLSLLARIHNVLVDDPSLELVVEYTNLWPNNISKNNNYNPKHILESLTEILERSLKLYPYNTSWLRLYGDVEMAGGRHSAALRRYLCALAVGSEYFAERAPDEGAIARRAARCCQALNAPTQAAALCQLADEPDYTTAFKCLAEKTSNASDATDAYYGCLWDGTLLEVAAATHARRGEGGKRARAVAAAGALELNANNTDDIRQRAANVRRARLLRALTAQYVIEGDNN